MSYADFFNKILKRQNRLEHQSFGKHQVLPMFLYMPQDEAIKARLSSGINIFKYAAPYPSSYLGININPPSTSERGQENRNFFPKDINFVDITLNPIDIGVVNPTGTNSALYSYLETYREPAVKNSVDTNRNNIATRFVSFDDGEHTLAFRKNSAIGIQLRIPSQMQGITIDNTDLANLCYIQKDYPLSTQTNTGNINNYRIKLVKATSIISLPLLDPDRIEGFESEITFPVDDFHPSDMFQLIYVTNPANPWINNWQVYASRALALDAINLAGTLLLDDFKIVSRVPDLYPNHPQGGPNAFPPAVLIGCGNSFGGNYMMRYSAFPAGPVNRTFFYGSNNLNTTSSTFILFNPQMGELLATSVGNTSIDYTSVQAFLDNTGMNYYYNNKECPLSEIGASGIRDDAGYNIWQPSGILSSRYLYQRDWNNKVVSSGHFLDYTAVAGIRFNSSTIDNIPGDPANPVHYPTYYWRPVFVMESPDAQLNVPIPQSNWILPCNYKATSSFSDADKFDPFRSDFPSQAKANNFSWGWIKNAGGNGQKFVFLENRPMTSSAFTHSSNPQGGSDARCYTAWCDPAAQNYGVNYTVLYTPSPTMNKKYTLSKYNPYFRGFNPDNHGGGHAFTTSGGRDDTWGKASTPLSGSGPGGSVVLRRRVFFNPQSGWPYLQAGFPGAATASVNMTGGENFSIAYTGYRPTQRMSNGVILFDVYSVDDERNTFISDFGNQFVLIGIAYAGFSGTKDPTVYTFHIGRPAVPDVNDPPNNYFFKVDGPIILKDRLNRPAPYMKVHLTLPDTPYWQMYASTDISLPPLSRWTSNLIELTSDSAGEIKDLWLYPLLKTGGLENITEEEPTVNLQLKAIGENVYFDTGNTLIVPSPGTVPPGFEAGHKFIFKASGLKVAVGNQQNAATLPNFIAVNGCSTPGSSAHNVLSPGAGGITFIDAIGFVPIAATLGGTIKDGHMVAVNIEGLFGGGFTSYVGAKSGNTGIADAELALSGPINVRTLNGGITIRIKVVSNVGSASGGFSVTLKAGPGYLLAPPYPISIYSVCPP